MKTTKNIKNNRIDQSILSDLSRRLKPEDFSDDDKIIISNTTQQFKEDLSDIWEELEDITRIMILEMIPHSWADFKEMIKTDVNSYHPPQPIRA